MIPIEYVVVPRAVCEQWWSKPYSEMRAAAVNGIDGLSLAVTPKKTIHKADGTTKEVDDFPYYVRGAMCFRESHISDGFRRPDVAALHSQGW